MVHRSRPVGRCPGGRAGSAPLAAPCAVARAPAKRHGRHSFRLRLGVTRTRLSDGLDGWGRCAPAPNRLGQMRANCQAVWRYWTKRGLASFSRMSGVMFRTGIQLGGRVRLDPAMSDSVLFGLVRVPDFVLTPADGRGCPELGFRAGSGRLGLFRPGWRRRAAGGRDGCARLVFGVSARSAPWGRAGGLRRGDRGVYPVAVGHLPVCRAGSGAASALFAVPGSGWQALPGRRRRDAPGASR